MILNNEVFLPVSVSMLDMEKAVCEEDDFTIPLKRTVENQDRYDEAYCYLGKGSGFMFDIMESKLNLAIRLNSIGQLDFSISVDFVEFRTEDVPSDWLDTYQKKVSVVLLDEELVEVFPIVALLFESEPSIEDLRVQVADAIPTKHMKDTMLFSEEVTQKGYHSVWATQDFKKCILAFIEDIGTSNSLVKAYVFG